MYLLWKHVQIKQVQRVESQNTLILTVSEQYRAVKIMCYAHKQILSLPRNSHAILDFSHLQMASVCCIVGKK